MFSRKLLTWYARHKRDLPWRTTTDPYAILISEVMLQQTQVERVVPKYEAWLKAFPHWEALARASRTDVLRAWSGLGYNRRAVRLHALAQLVVEEHGGRLPTTEANLRKLPGIGPYTAGALMAFAHDKPGACIDVNVARVVKRYTFQPKQAVSKNEVEEALLNLYSKRVRDFANALMDFGSTVCTATDPRCEECPLRAACQSKGERPEEAALRTKRRQSPFLHSNRWWRGQILKAVNRGVECEADELYRAIVAMHCHRDKRAFKKALRELEEERLVDPACSS